MLSLLIGLVIEMCNFVLVEYNKILIYKNILTKIKKYIRKLFMILAIYMLYL